MPLVARRAIQLALMTGGFLLAGTAQASAADGLLGGDELGGNEVLASVQAPTTICGNAVAVAGSADGSCTTSNTTSSTSGSSSLGTSVGTSGTSAGTVSVGSGGTSASANQVVVGGNQVDASVSAPVTICGNAVAVAGTADAGCGGSGSSSGSGSSTGTVVGGNDVVGSVSAPVTVCGNAVTVAGDATGSCTGSNTSGSTSTGSGGSSTGGGSGGSSNAVVGSVSAPVTVCGNAVGVAGSADATCTGSSTWGGTSTGGNGGGSSNDFVRSVSASGAIGLVPVADVVTRSTYPRVAGLDAVVTGTVATARGARTTTAAGAESRPITAVLAAAAKEPKKAARSFGSLARTGATLTLWVLLAGICLMLLGVATRRAGVELPAGAQSVLNRVTPGNTWTAPRSDDR